MVTSGFVDDFWPIDPTETFMSKHASPDKTPQATVYLPRPNKIDINNA
jgi:hypothetical protein